MRAMQIAALTQNAWSPSMMMVLMMVMMMMMVMIIIIIITNLNTNTNCLIRFGDTKAPSSSFARVAVALGHQADCKKSNKC